MCHCRKKVTVQFKEIENSHTTVNLAAGIKDNFIDNIRFVHLTYKGLAGDQATFNTKIVEMDLAMPFDSSKIIIRSW